MQSRLFPLAADIGDYQSGVLMHEFGHLLGLCHPTSIVGCAALPAAEANPAVTIMGTPAETPPLFVIGPITVPNSPQQLFEALARPRDYSATQWTRLRPGAGLVP
jgi:hypothetical protein